MKQKKNLFFDWHTALHQSMAVYVCLLVFSICVNLASAATTNVVMFLETMATNAVKPWTGTGCSNAWTVAFNATNPFEQNRNANYGTGNTNGLAFIRGTFSLADSTITTTKDIDARVSNGTLGFYTFTQGLSNGVGWAVQLNSGSGFTTRLQETNGVNHGWQLSSYALQPADLVSNLTLRFQFSGCSANSRIWFDQIALTSTTGSGTSSNVTFIPYYVHIPGGSFVMGDHFEYIDLKHYTDEVPLHTVVISPFTMSTTLCTMREYCDFLNASRTQGLIEVRGNLVYATGGTNVYFYTHDASPNSLIQWADNTFSVLDGRDLRPVTSVHWFGAIAFCNWLSARDGFESCYNLDTGDVDFSKNGFRLPTEAEWEYAAHGGPTDTYSMFPWGTNTNVNGTYANWENSGDPFESTNAYPCTTPVGFYNGSLRLKSDYNWPGSQTTYQTSDGSNQLGLYDMAGNVWEWCNDWYMNTYYTNCVINNVVTNPPGPMLAQADLFDGLPYHCLRGGTWWNGNSLTDADYGHARVSNRDPSYFLGGGPPGDPYAQWSQAGFRVMRPEKLPQTVGLFLNSTNAFPGYTLMSPMQGRTAYLLNNTGQYVRAWSSGYNPGRADCLMENGHYMRMCSLGMQSELNSGGGEGGRHEERDWLGNLVWSFDYNYTNKMTHHDFKILPNGNLIIIMMEVKSTAEVLAAGFNPAQLSSSITTNGGFMLPDAVIEVQPIRPYGGTVVWEWHVWDHLVQEYDPAKDNYGVVSNHYERINANPPSGGYTQQFFNHFNGIDYNPQYDQIMLSSRNQSEIWIIDHSTTTAEAAGHTGGKYGKGGDLLYRWGNPLWNKQGTAVNQMLFQQHCCLWIPTNYPGGGHILIHNNGIGRTPAQYTSIDEIVPPVDANGNYTRTAGAAFGPTNLFWTYKDSTPTNFFGADIGGVERLPNGNTLITFGIRGTLFEVTPAGQTVWKYINPVTQTPLAQGTVVPFDSNSNPKFPLQTLNEVFKVHRYPTNFVGFVGKDLAPRGTIETYTGTTNDTVGLGLPDVWVRANFGSLSAVSSTSDADGDGIPDRTEYSYGISPTQADGDGDGIPDGWEFAYSRDPSYAGDATNVAANGYSYLDSYQADLTPTNPSSQLRFTSIGTFGSEVDISWIGGNNAWQYLECCDDLSAGQWRPVFTNAPPTLGTNTVTIAHTNSLAPQRFYRLKANR